MQTIMVVDDLAIIRDLLASALEKFGFRSKAVAGGEQALIEVRQERPDLIVLDMRMPEVDGLTFLKALRGDPKSSSIPVIVLTLDTDRNDILAASRIGVQDYILKAQFSMPVLIDRIQTRLKEFSARQEGPSGEPQASQPGGERSPSSISLQQPAAMMSSGDESPRERLKKMTPLLTRTQLNERLQSCKDLKAMSPTVSRLMEMVNTASCSIEKIASAVQQDQAVAVKVLRLANSAVFFRGGPVDSVQKAVMRIGIQQVRQAVISLGVMERFHSADSSSGIALPQFWEHSIACGLISSMIAKRRGAKEHETAFTMGLLHDVGRLVYIEVLGEQYHQVLATARELRLPLEEVEARMLSMNHADASAAVLRDWRFPKEMIAPIALHHQPLGQLRRNAVDCFRTACTVALADRMAHAMLLGDSGNETIYPIDELIDALELPADAIEQIEREVPTQAQEIKFAMLARSGQDAWASQQEAITAKISGDLRTIFIASGEEGQACRMMFDRLRLCANAGRANWAAVYAREEHEIANLLEKLQSAEAKAGVGPLPLLMFSRNGTVGKGHQALSERVVRFLPATFALCSLSEHVKQATSDPACLALSSNTSDSE